MQRVTQLPGLDNPHPEHRMGLLLQVIGAKTALANYRLCKKIFNAGQPDFRGSSCCCYPSAPSIEERGREYARQGTLLKGAVVCRQSVTLAPCGFRPPCQAFPLSALIERM
eukprot:scaffold4470_cov255-Prasinococcus_capsulatus_cf.AAC.22